jgi:hypothetical protein
MLSLPDPDDEPVDPIADVDVPADVLAEFNARLEAAVSDWGDALEAAMRQTRRTNK